MQEYISLHYCERIHFPMGVKMSTYQEMEFSQFQEHFQTEDQCFEHLKKIRWGNGYRCPRRGYTEAYFIEERKIFQCKHCRFQASLTTNTMFHRSHLPLRKWFWAIYLVGTDTGVFRNPAGAIAGSPLQNRLAHDPQDSGGFQRPGCQVYAG